jgi:predicted anti-sigma-YlaC factor YlaD
VKTDIHERARVLIALSGPEGVPGAEKSWLAAHLESCVACREFAENSAQAVRSLRARPITAGASLVSATRIRVRQRAEEMRRRQERLWMVGVCCAAVTLCSAFTTAVLWRGFAWMATQTWLPAPTREAGFAVFLLMPAILTGILLLARGTYLVDPDSPRQD